MSAETRTDRAQEELPPQVHMPLLDYVIANSLDGDYAQAAERTEAGDGGERPRIRPGIAALAVMGLFGILVTTAAIQTARNAGDESAGKESLVTQIKVRSAQVEARRERAANLREENESLQSLFLDTTTEGRALSARLDRLGVVTGAVPVTGPGVKVVVDDAPDATTDKQRVLDKDLQKLVNALWASGAEAISINGQRLTNVSPIRNVGEAIHIKSVPLRPPYNVVAIGDTNTLQARFAESVSGIAWGSLVNSFGFEFSMTNADSLSLPGSPTPTLRSAQQAPEGPEKEVGQ